MTPDGLIVVKSVLGTEETLLRLRSEIQSKGLTVFAEIDHAAGAAAARMELRPTTVVIFGNAKGGTPLMQLAQTIGIDLPLKMLVWRDASGQTWLGYNDPSWLAKRHEVGDKTEQIIVALRTLLDALAKRAACAN
ncbi:MAG: hypothetical protein C5B58_15455 [Acidobacteria bacterium]|nr:MAG: hypothetical protein C5B58_15455 [Acidobacteriota bacterium]